MVARWKAPLAVLRGVGVAFVRIHDVEVRAIRPLPRLPRLAMVRVRGSVGVVRPRKRGPVRSW